MRKNSIKQMMRMPVKTISFFVLIFAMGFLISLAAGMFVKTTANISGYRKLFKTIGTVTQKEDFMSRQMVWDAELKNYKVRQFPEYKEIVPIDAIDFEGADYIVPPEKRNYYASYAPDYYTDYSHTFNYMNNPMETPIVEFSPDEDCVPDECVRINVKKVLSGWQSYAPSVLWFCDHYNENPEMLYKDKTYIAYLRVSRHAHGKRVDAEVPDNKRNITREFEPVPLSFNLFDENGNSIKKNDTEFKNYYEVTDDFYDTDIGKYYLNYAKGIDIRFHTFPVTGTNSTDLLLPFYNGNVFISDGRDISNEAYENGLNECLVSQSFAKNNELEVGDSVTANLIFTSANLTAAENYVWFGIRTGASGGGGGGGIFDFSPIMDDGEVPATFETKDYTIVGIYDSASYGMSDARYQMGSDEMIVPLNSIENKDKNILDFGPMNEFTTSFQIPNGTIDDYREKFEKSGLHNLDIQFYDMGYTKLERGMKNMRFMAVVFGIAGIVLGAVLLIFYSKMFINGQKVRITIERCMGITVPECRRSLITGAMTVLFLGSIIGCLLGVVFSGTISAYDMGKEIFDTTYTAGHVADVDDIVVLAGSRLVMILTGLLCELFILLSGYGILQKGIGTLLKQEPLYLLDDINRE